MGRRAIKNKIGELLAGNLIKFGKSYNWAEAKIMPNFKIKIE
jgi:hypothetical protein